MRGGSGERARRRFRLHRRRRRHRRLHPCQSPLGRPEQARAAAGGRRQGQLDLVSHPGRLSVRDRQSALGLDVQDRGRSRPERPRPRLPARQGDRRLVCDQRHDLDARTGRRLRPLAAARPHRLGLGRCAALLQAAGGPFPRRHRAPRRRRRLAHRGAAAVVGNPRRRGETPRARWASANLPTSTPATTRASATSMSTRSAAGAGRQRAAFSSPRWTVRT